jgi:Bacterial toxin 5
MSGHDASKRLRDAFMQHALRTILAGIGGQPHPLAFLIHPASRKWHSRHMYAQEPTVQAGHLTSRHSGQAERFALEDSTWNQWSSNKGESQGAIFFKAAVLIGNVPVEHRTAMTWESTGLLTTGTMANARPSSGWSR